MYIHTYSGGYPCHNPVVVVEFMEWMLNLQYWGATLIDLRKLRVVCCV